MMAGSRLITQYLKLMILVKKQEVILPILMTWRIFKPKKKSKKLLTSMILLALVELGEIMYSLVINT
jgi:hypothetical protein